MIELMNLAMGMKRDVDSKELMILNPRCALIIPSTAFTHCGWYDAAMAQEPTTAQSVIPSITRGKMIFINDKLYLVKNL